MIDRVGQQLGNYRLTEFLGEGGFATIYLGEHIHLKTKAAIKIQHTQLTRDALENFLTEARTIANLQHPNIIGLLDFGIEGGAPFFVMQYAPNGNLRQRYPKGSRFPLVTILPHIKQAATALQYAHDKKLIHRDVKPENMLLGSNDDVLLSDFGIAVTAQTNISILNMAGTVAYMAPEQINAKPRPASDQYALGIIVYEWLCGERPFEGSFVEIAVKHLTTPPPPLHQKVPEISPAVELVIMTALNKDPQQRFASVQAFANALERTYQIEHQGLSNTNLYQSTSSSPQDPTIRSISSTPTISMPGPIPPMADFPTVSQTLPTLSEPPIPPEEHLPELLPSENLCPYCAAKTRPVSRFCSNCGNSLFFTAPSQETAGSISQEDFVSTIVSKNKYKCPFCGSEIQIGDIFCLNCGNRLIHEARIDHEHPGTIGTRFMSTFEGKFDTARGDTDNFESSPSLSIAPSQEQIPHDEPHVISLNNIAPPQQSSSPSYSTITLEQTISQLLEEGEIHYKARRFDEALIVYNHIIQLDSHNAHAYGSKGNVLGRLGRFKQALVAYDSALVIDSKHVSIWNSKGDILFKLRRYEQALEAYNEALELDSENVRTWTAKANTLFKLRRYEETLDAFNQAIVLKANYAVIWSKGKVLFELERYEEALEAYEQSLRISPKKAAIWDEKGEVLYKLKRYQEALDDHNRALALDPYNSSISRKCDRLRDLIKHLQKRPTQPQPAQPSAEQVISMRDQARRNEYAHAQQHWPESSEQARKEDEKTAFFEYFDVFLSYSATDMEWVENLAHRLVDEHHFQIWLDKWVLIPGQSWQQAKARGLDQARCCAVCIGEHTPNGWTEQEIQRAKNRQAKDPSFGVIPVLLPTAKNVNVDNFLELNALVDFRDPDQAYAFHLLVSGIKREPPGRWPPKEITSTRTSTLVQDMLQDLQRLRQTNLITEPVKEEFMRLTMEKFWITGWTLQVKDNINE